MPLSEEFANSVHFPMMDIGLETKLEDRRNYDASQEQDLKTENDRFLASGVPVRDEHTNIDSAHSEEAQGAEKKLDGVGKWLNSRVGPAVLCPTLSWPLQVVTAILFALLLWGAAYTLLKEHVAPESNLFRLAMLFVLAYLAGQLVGLLRLPPLLGMLLVGIAMRNLGFFSMSGAYLEVVSILRNVAMVVILIKAGLGLDAGALRKLSLVVLRLAFIPCLVEASTVAVVSHFVMGLPWLWGMLLGFVLGAVSPAVVVPSLLSLKDRGYGEDKGISTLVIAASSMDDIFAISGYGVILGTIFSEGDLTQQILQGPLEVVIGLVFGITWGTVIVYVPHRNDSLVVPVRAFMVGAGGLFAVLGSQIVGFSGAGPLACITAAFVGCSGWKMLGWSNSYNPVQDIFSVIWKIFQPVLFGLIGTEIDLFQLDRHTLGFGMAVLSSGLSVRILASYLAVHGSSLKQKEMLFVAISWFPKATVQAALGPVALDLARKKGEDASIVEYASQVLTIAVLSILLTAPVGAVGIYLAGPRLLNRVRHPPQGKDVSILSEA
ncbi:sodium/hydrogen exchanger 9B2 isoform X2 [Anabrus simplex]|uniref:sodium/hydrogen exchanger 9B2 isoform X2 n=1 Tax=Anabrus simplex TaxID=316456 RepID=UPI0035A27BC8